MTYPDPTRPGANGNDEPSVLELLGFGTPSATGHSAPQAPAASNLPPHARAPIAQARRRPDRVASSASSSASRSPARPPAASGPSRSRTARPRASCPRAPASPSPRPPPRARPRGTSRARSIGSRILSVSAMIFAGALAVGMSVPANAFNTGARRRRADAGGRPGRAAAAAQANQSMAADSTRRDHLGRARRVHRHLVGRDAAPAVRHPRLRLRARRPERPDPLAVPVRRADQLGLRRARRSLPRLLEHAHGRRLHARWRHPDLRGRRRRRRPARRRLGRLRQPRLSSTTATCSATAATSRASTRTCSTGSSPLVVGEPSRSATSSDWSA